MKKSPLTQSLARLPLLACFALFPAGLVCADYPTTVVAQQPVGYYRLNENIPPLNTSTATNIGSLGASANGEYIASASGGLPGPFAGSTAVSFDGLAQNVSTPWVAGLNTAAFTFETWVNPADPSAFLYVASSVVMAAPRTGWYLAQDGPGGTFGAGSAYVARFFVNSGATFAGQVSAAIGPANQWMHLVVTCNGTTAAMYTNGVLATSTTLTGTYVPNVSAPFRVGTRSDNAFFWPGKVAETALYNTALSAGRVAAPYTAATTAPATYQATVLADSPALYHRYKEAGSPPAANSGTLGSAGNGTWQYNANPTVAGPRPATFPGFAADNRAAGFDGVGGGNVRVPALNLNTNTVTISGWIKAAGSQAFGAGIAVTGSGPTASGLTMSRAAAGLGLGYVWNGNDYGVNWTTDLFLPEVPDNQWTFVALVVEPAKATIFNSGGSDYNSFAWAENTFNVSHGNAAFNGATLIGLESGVATRNFNGAIDEIAIFNRALSKGEVYTQFADAVGGVPPQVFGFAEGPLGQVPVGDPIVLKVDAGGTQPMTYTWQRGGTNYASTTTGVLRIESASLTDSETYSVTVGNASGSGVYGGAVYVQVVTPSTPTITATEGFTDRAIYPGGSLRLSATATGGGVKYAWYKNGAAIAGATASAYTIASITNSDAGNYAVSVTNLIGRASNGPVAITVPTPTPGSYAAAVVSSAPRAWWRLGDPAAATVLLDSMGRHDGSYTNVNSTVPPVTLGVPGALLGDTNTAASFNGAGGLGIIPHSSALNPTRFTYEAWVRTTAPASPEMSPLSSCSSSDGIWWGTTTDLGGAWAPRSNPNSVAPIYDDNPQSAIIPNAWTHLVMCYDSSRVISGTQYPWTYYVNGVTDGFVWSGPTPTSDGSFIIGGRGRTAPVVADLFFNGQVDEVAVYQRVLPATEIQAHFAARGVEILPPTFTTALLSQTVTAGKTVSFSTTVLGTSPALQWLKNGAPVDSATNATLTLSGVTTADEGTYTLRASNSAATNTTSATLTVIAPTSYANVTNDLVLHLRGDGNVTDSSGRGNNGNAIGGITYETGLIGPNALRYQTTVDGTGTNVATASYVRLGSPADLRFGTATSFSVGLWVKVTAGNVDGDLPYIGNATNAMNNPGWVLGPAFETGGWQWCLNDGTNNIDVNGPDNSINRGGWHHFVLVVNRGTKVAQSYLDGVLASSRDITTLGSVDNSALTAVVIGQDTLGLYPEAGSATLDDIGIWRRALAAADVASIESAGRTAGRSFDTVAPTSVTLAISRSGSNLILQWPNGTLLQSDALGAAAVWTPVPGAAAPSHTVTPAGASKYYRVLNP